MHLNASNAVRKKFKTDARRLTTITNLAMENRKAVQDVNCIKIVPAPIRERFKGDLEHIHPPQVRHNE